MSAHLRFHHLIIGNSAAAIAAVEAIRAAHDAHTVALVGEESCGVYARHLISYYLTGERSADTMRFRPQSFYQQHGVEALLGAQALAIDWESSTVHLSNGETAEFHDLLLAVGAKPILPPLPGRDLQGVFTFTNLTQATALHGALANIGSVVVIGGGLIGLQVAEALHNLGKSVSVVELMPRLLAPVLDQVAADLVADRVRSRGISLHLGVGAQAVLPSENHPNNVGGVELANGTKISADAVVMAVGVTPRLELLQGSEIQTNRGILVDEYMSTSRSNVYAAGDVAAGREITSGQCRLVPVWPNAMRQGHIAGLAMAGHRQPDTGSLMMNAAHFFGLPIISAGLHDPQPDAGCTILRVGPDKNSFYRKLVMQGNRVLGLVAVGGAVDRAGIIYGLIRSGAAVDESVARHLVERCDLTALGTNHRWERLAGRLVS